MFRSSQCVTLLQPLINTAALTAGLTAYQHCSTAARIIIAKLEIQLQYKCYPSDPTKKYFMNGKVILFVFLTLLWLKYSRDFMNTDLDHNPKRILTWLEDRVQFWSFQKHELVHLAIYSATSCLMLMLLRLWSAHLNTVFYFLHHSDSHLMFFRSWNHPLEEIIDFFIQPT